MGESMFYNISGLWEGTGVEVQINRETNEVTQTTLRLVRKIELYRKNTYIFNDTYFFPDGTINFGPTKYLVDTGGSTDFIYADDYATGIDTVIINYLGTGLEFLRYVYNINNISPDVDPLYKSLNGTYNLNRVLLE